MEEQAKAGFEDNPTNDKIPVNATDPISAPSPLEVHQPTTTSIPPQQPLIISSPMYEKRSNGNVMAMNMSQGDIMGSGGALGLMGASGKRKYVKKKEMEDPAYMPSTSIMYKRRRKRRVSMAGLLEGGIKGAKPVNERNIERVLDRSLHLTDSMLQLLLSSKDDLKRLCGGVNVEAVAAEKLAKTANNKKLMEIVEKINKAYVEYHKTIDNIAELGKGEDGEEEEEYEDDDDDDDEEDYQMSKGKHGRFDNGDEGGMVVKKRPYHRKQPYNKKQQVKNEGGYDGSGGVGYGGGSSGGGGNLIHHHTSVVGDKNNYYSNKNNTNNATNEAETRPWEIKKEKPWDWPEDKGHDLDPNVSNDLVMTCEPGSDDETLYNVGFPKFNRNY